jgi:segregation and condensation protein B
MSDSDDDDHTPDESFWGQLDAGSVAEPADWAGDELEKAYLRAIEALEASDAQLPELPAVPEPLLEPVFEADAVPVPPDVLDDAPQISSTTHRIDQAELSSALTELADEAVRRQSPAHQPSSSVSPRQILEALLFVGGEPLTVKRLVNVLRGEFTPEFIETEMEGLNSLYAVEGRPYEIRMGDGGYRLALRGDFEKIRRKAYGLGPKEVKLSQEAIEVLAVIAYHQPLTATAIEELGKPGCGTVLRQLLRRELIVVERSAGRPRDVAYRTTPRFLSLFGIRSLNELPRLEQVVYK